MQKLVYLIGAIAILASTAYLFMHRAPTQGISEEVMINFNAFKIQYNKHYDAVEEVYRLTIFNENYMMIQHFNTHESQKEGFVMGVNQFADMKNDEFQAMYLGYKSNGKRDGIPQSESQLSQQPPAEVNWVTKGDVTPVKDQGQCGSCYAFSSTGSLESVDAIFGTGLGNFSEQQLVDCSQKYGNNGCNGGLMDNCFKYVIANGITTETAYPYTGVQGTCKTTGGAFKITSYTDVKAKNCSALQIAVAQQPTSVAVDAQSWQFYKTGIFSRCGTSLDHGVLAVGYTSTYWLVKNSWGTSWGMQGYIELKFGDTCGICNEASYPNLK